MKIKRVLKEIKNIDYKEVKSLSEKLQKKTFYVLFDVLKSIRKYDCSFSEYLKYEFYNLSDEERSTYLTDYINESIVLKYNCEDDFNIFLDASVFYKTFSDFINRSYIDLRLCSFKDFKEYILDKDRVVVRHVFGYDSKRVLDIDKGKLKNEYNVLKMYNSIMKNEEFIVEECLDVSDEFRVVSYVDDSGNVNILDMVSVKNGVYKVCKDYNMVKSFVSKVAKTVNSVKYVMWNISVVNDILVLNGGSVRPDIYTFMQVSSGKKEGCLIEYKKYINVEGD